MEKVSQRESILLGLSPQSQRYLFNNNQNQYNSISSSRRNSSDIDFSDVFGGPPRRASIQETRCSFNDSNNELRSTNHDHSDDDDDNEDSNFAEKPVFGDELSGVNKRRYHNEDFFDDIFKGKDYSLSSSPRMLDRDLLSSSYPRSRVLSPVRPLPPKAESFLGSSFPAQFSLPARLIKGTDLPAFGSGSRTQYKNKDGVSNGASSYSFSPLSRTSNQGSQVRDGLENNVYPQYSLSRQVSISSEESFDLAKPNEKFLGDQPKPESQDLSNKRRLERQQSALDLEGPEVQNKEDQFHFSIYKWAGKGVPLAMPFRGGRSLGLKSKFERSSSYNAWINGDGLLKRTPKVTPHDLDFPSCNSNFSSPSTSLTVETKGVKDGSFADISLQGAEEQCHSIEEASLPKSEPESSSSHPVIAEDDVSNILAKHTKEPEANDVAESLSSVAVESHKKGRKQLHSFLFNNDHEPAVGKAVKNEELKGNKVKSDKKSSAGFNVGEGVKKGGDRSTIVGNGEADNANIEKKKVGGKVTEFVKIFNQGAPCKAELDGEFPRQKSKRKETGKLRTQDAPNATSTVVDEKLHSMNRNNRTDVSIVADEYLKKSEKQPPEARPNNTNFTPGSKRSTTPNLDSSEQTPESAPAGLESRLGYPDEFFHANFLVEELPLPHEDDKLPQLTPSLDEVQVIDDKIRDWSRGKEGNIRSLLSTLQFVLWAESGWKPVPLMDIIEGNAVRRSYQKALLSLHPDKLQQKGATSNQKYTAEKVFDILQEAWKHFSSPGSV